MLRVCILNLKRRPDRRTKFQQLNRHSDLHFDWIVAVDGQDLDRSQLVAQGLLDLQHHHFLPGSLGCALSHYSLWQRCIQAARPFLIFEDDVVLRQDFAAAYAHLQQQLPPTWDYIQLGYNFNSILDVAVAPEISLKACFYPHFCTEDRLKDYVQTTLPPVALRLHGAFGTCAYAISPKGAEQLIQLCFPLKGITVKIPALNRIIKPAPSLDTIMNDYYRRLQAFCAVPPLAITPNDPTDSDTLGSG